MTIAQAPAGSLYERIHTRDITQMGGFWSKVPFMGTIAMVFAMASLGLPGLGNFIAEFLILVGAWQANEVLTIFATIGLVAATAYSLRIVQKVFLGKDERARTLVDLSLREKLILVPMVIVIVWLGLFPQPVLNTSKRSTTGMFPDSKSLSVIKEAMKEKGGSHDQE